MQENEFENSIDISSMSRKPTQKSPVRRPSNGFGNIIKTIAFLVGFFFVAVTFVAAFFLYSKSPLFMAIALAVIIAGTVFATIVTLLIYALGHLIVQNNEIIDKLNRFNRF
ncbi:MAG: hypothetical protein IKI29_07070 [Clostridia bacterium]|nr:hypothetical protein [Clostridia bacterium]